MSSCRLPMLLLYIHVYAILQLGTICPHPQFFITFWRGINLPDKLAIIRLIMTICTRKVRMSLGVTLLHVYVICETCPCASPTRAAHASCTHAPHALLPPTSCVCILLLFPLSISACWGPVPCTHAGLGHHPGHGQEVGLLHCAAKDDGAEGLQVPRIRSLQDGWK